MIIVILTILLVYSAPLTGITLLGVIPAVLLGLGMGNKLKVLTKDMQNKQAKLTSTAEEAFGNVRTVKAFANEVEETSKFM